MTSFHCSPLDLGGASEVDAAEHREVQPALLLHVHEDGQLQGEEEVSRPPGISLPPAKQQTPKFTFDLQHLVDAGLMRDDELKVFQDLDTKVLVKSIDISNHCNWK